MKIQIKLQRYTEGTDKSKCWRCSLRGKWILFWRDEDGDEHTQGPFCGDFWDDAPILVCELHMAESVREVQAKPEIIEKWLHEAERKAMDMSDPDTIKHLQDLEEDLNSPEMKKAIRSETGPGHIVSDVKAEQRDWEQG